MLEGVEQQPFSLTRLLGHCILLVAIINHHHPSSSCSIVQLVPPHLSSSFHPTLPSSDYIYHLADAPGTFQNPPHLDPFPIPCSLISAIHTLLWVALANTTPSSFSLFHQPDFTPSYLHRIVFSNSLLNETSTLLSLLPVVSFSSALITLTHSYYYPRYVANPSSFQGDFHPPRLPSPRAHPPSWQPLALRPYRA